MYLGERSVSAGEVLYSEELAARGGGRCLPGCCWIVSYECACVGMVLRCNVLACVDKRKA